MSTRRALSSTIRASGAGLVLALAALGATACEQRPARSGSEHELELAELQVTDVSVEQVDALLAQGACTAVDANGRATREREGVVPGAIILSHYARYAAAELPADKTRKLVFYCTNEHCGASHAAAARAVVAGHADVAVMAAGIVGWKAAGKQAKAL